MGADPLNSAVGFWSYVHADDEAEGGRIRRLAERIRNEYSVLTGEDLAIFVDREDIAWGDEWRRRIADALAMRIERAIDAFLDWRRLERDATPRSVDSYRRILWKLAEDYPEVDLGSLTKVDLRAFLLRWKDKSAATRSNVVSVLHSFFAWATAEDLIDVDPSAPLRRPNKRRPDVYHPSLDELAAIRAATFPHERPAIVLMEGAGLRRAEVLSVRWADVNLVRGFVRALRKGQHWHLVPLAPDVLEELRRSFRELQPELDDHVFTVEVEQWVSQYDRVRRRMNPKVPASEQALWRMVKRVCKRAGVRELSPHQLRHGFANRFLRESRP